MAHYAQVLDGVVQTVIVIDDEKEDVALLASLMEEGTRLIKASYNTREGVHYGQDGEPDGGEALRFNFPQAGYIYDELRDAFYARQEKPFASMYFCEKTMRWKLPLPNKAVRRVFHGSVKRKVFLTSQGFEAFGPLVLDNLARSLGLEFITNHAAAEIALPVTDQETRFFAARPEFNHNRPMTERQLLNITDRLVQQSLGFPVLPAWRGRTKEEVLALPNEPLFVKRQRTHAKDTNPMSYSTWQNPKEFVKNAPASFWEMQAEPDPLYGEFIFQPYISHPFSGLDLRIAVNNQSETHVWCESMMTYEDIDVLGKWVPFTGDCSKEKEAVAKLVKDQGLKAGVHLLQFVWYKDAWVLMDWNSRITGAQLNLFPTAYPVLNDAFAHMLGLPLLHEADNIYWEQRSYRTWQLDRRVESLVGECGLFARWVNDKLHRVAAIGTSKREVEERYAQLDLRLSQRSSV